MKIKFMYNGIKIDGKLYRAHYSKNILINNTEESITIYARDYSDGLPKIDGLTVENHSESMTDYYEKDKIRIRKNNPLWESIDKAYSQQETKRERARINRKAKDDILRDMCGVSARSARIDMGYAG